MGKAQIAALAASAALLLAAPAAAEDFCVDASRAECAATLAEALQSARTLAGPDRVLLTASVHAVPAGSADAPGEPVEIVGAGPGTRLVAATGAQATLVLDTPASRVSDLTIAAPAPDAAAVTLRIAGVASRVVVEGQDGLAVRMAPGARVTDATLRGAVVAGAPGRLERSSLEVSRGAALRVEGGAGFVAENLDVVLGGNAEAALESRCAAVVARHLTVTGTAVRVVVVGCADAPALLDLRDSVLHGTFADVAATTGQGAVASAFSLHAEDTDIVATERLEPADPGFSSASNHRLAVDSVLVDAADPAPLHPGEGSSDLGGLPRVADGNGDAILRRDVGAHERAAAAVPPPEGNVLTNPGAENGPAMDTTGEGPAPAGWTRTGAFTAVAYGTTARTASGVEIALPTRPAAAAMGAGLAFFSAASAGEGSLTQRVDLTASAAAIDGVGGASAGASATLSGLIGGYAADDDEVRVTATFRDPAGETLGALVLGPLAATARGNATNLLPRMSSGPIPARTRAIDVAVTGVRVSAAGSSEAYADAYADNLALVLSVPGFAAPGPVDPGEPPVKNLRPFGGVTVLSGRTRLTPRGRTRVTLVCGSSTVVACTGALELRAQLRRGHPPGRIAQFARFRLGPGRRADVTIKLTLAARRALRRIRSFRATLRAVAVDGQGLERRTTVPLRIRR